MADEDETVEIGVIGALGDMGRLYIREWLKEYDDDEDGGDGGGKRRRRLQVHIHACDLETRAAEVRAVFAAEAAAGRVTCHADGHGVARAAQVLLFSVEASAVEACIGAYARSARVGAVAAGQTSVKAGEMRAFDAALPADVSVVSLHSLHGPRVPPRGQPLVLVPHRVVRPAHLALMRRVVAPFRAVVVEMSAREHDAITADTQAVTHVAFLSMGAAWAAVGVYPWFTDTYAGSSLLEHVKVAITMRIYFSKWHVYAGLAVLNDDARIQIRQYAKSATELFELMIQEKHLEFSSRIMAAAAAVFGNYKTPLLQSLMDQEKSTSIPPFDSKPNSHLSILAIVDSWYQTKTNPFTHLSLVGTPPFRLWLGISQYLFITPSLLAQTINTALYDKSIRFDDLHFVLAVTEWSAVVNVGSFDGYREKFETVARFFQQQEESMKWQKRSDDLIRNLGL